MADFNVSSAFIAKIAAKTKNYTVSDRTSPGLFSVDAKLPNEWQQSYDQQTEMLSNIQAGTAGNPVEVDSRGIPVNWDYKTSKTGPWGEPLPARAVGWLPTAQPDFGPGISGWWQRTLNNIYEDREDEEDAPRTTEILQGLFDSIGQAHAQRDEVIEEGAEPGDKKRQKANLGILGTAAAGTIGATLEIVKNAWHSLEGEEVTPITAIPRVIGETFRTAGDLLQKPAEWAESEVIGPRLLANIELAQKYNLVTQEDIDGWDGWIGQLGIFPVWGRVASAVMTGKISRDEFYSLDNEYRNQTAAKIAYTAWKDTAVKEEFLRRTRAGEDPRLLALELEDPVDEMVLEFIFDPLNAIDVWYTGTKALTRGTRLWSKLNKGRVAEALTDVTKAIRTAADLGDEAELARLSVKISPVIDNAVQTVLKGEGIAATRRGWFAPLQTFNQHDRAEDMINVFQDILRATDMEPDRAAGTLRAMSMVIDPDADKKMEGIAMLRSIVDQTGGKLDYDLLFSDEAIRSTIIFRDLITDAAGNFSPTSKLDAIALKARVAVDASGDVVRKAGARKELRTDEVAFIIKEDLLMDGMSQEIGNILKRRFPVIQEAIKQNEKYIEIVAKHGEDSAQAINYLRKNPAAATKVSSALKRMVPFHEKAQKFFYRPAADIQSKVFMGMNPGYMYRNRIGNFMAILSDQGPRTAWRAMAPRVLGGVENSERYVKNWLGSMSAGLRRSQAAPHSAFTLSESAASWGPILRTAQEDEKLARIHVATKVIGKVMRDVMHPKRALSGIDTVLTDPADVKLFTKLSKLNEHGGDIDKIWRAFSDIRGTDVARTMEGISDYDMHFMAEMGLDDDLFKILSNPELTQTDVVRHLEELKEDWAEWGLLAAREPVLMEADLAEHADTMEGLIGHYGEELGQLKGDEFLRRVNANNAHLDAAKAEATEAFDKIGKQAIHDALDLPEGLSQTQYEAAVQQARVNQKAITEGVFQSRTETFQQVDKIYKKTRAEHYRFVTQVKKMSDNANSYDQVRLVEIWEGGILRFNGKPVVLGPVLSDPELLGAKELKDALWTQYRALVEGSYNDTTDMSVGLLRDAANGLDQYLKTGETVADFIGPLAAKTDDAGVIAHMMRNATVDPDTGATIYRGTREEIDEILPVVYKKVLSKSKTALPDEKADNIMQKLEGLRKKYAEDPILDPAEAFDVAMDKDLQDAISSLDYPGRKKLAEFLVGGDVGAVPEVSALMNTIENEIDLFDVVRVDGLIDTDKGRSALAVARWSDWSGEGKVTLEVSNELLNQAPEVVQKILMEEVAHSLESIGYQDELRDLFKVDDMSDEAALEAATDAIVGIMRGEEVPNAERLQEILDKETEVFEAMGKFMPDDVKTYDMPLVGPMDSGTASPARFIHETGPTANNVIDNIIGVVEDNFQGGIEAKAMDVDTRNRFNEWRPEVLPRIERAKTEAARQSIAAGDFAMHNYGKRMGIDLVASYIFPYQFWYSRSYAKWMQRAVRHPGMAGAYFRYKETLAKQHAGLPDWWKYQLNTNELLGLDSDHPVWFNLEALVNPIHGLTGVDFEDPKRRIDGWGAWMEDMNKFGPTVWSPYQLALALKYSVQGEDEAAARWAGRILPFSKSLRDVTALADPKGLGIEIDPYVHLFGGGIEAYERGRVGRQLGLMMDDPEFNKADVIDATYNQEGDLWDTARARTIQERSPNAAFALAPFFFGAGAKPRSIDDQVIDRMYGQMDGLIKNRDNMSDNQYRTEWQQLRQQYPFMDTVLMSKKAGPERDEALSWNVLSRIPPGMTKAIAEQAGVSRNVLDAFYEEKGDLSAMSEPDRLRFMGTILEIGGLLDIPEKATNAEWNVSRGLYKSMRNAGAQQFGDDIWDLVDVYFATRDPDDPEVSRTFLQNNPSVSDALDWQQVMIQNTPLLAAYYTSDERIRQFYKTQMYQTAEQLFGADLWDKFEIYSRLKDLGEDKAAREFWKDNPELSGYMELKEDTLPTIEEKVDHFGTIIPEAKPPKYRHEEYDITPQAPVEDGREADITAQVLAYSEAFTDYSGQRTDIRTILREQADEIWPNTRSGADKYYQMLAGGDASGAATYLSEEGELQARVMWEFDKIQRLDLTTLGQLFQSAGAAPGMEQPLEAPPGIDPNTPLGRLFNDPQGIPEHLWEAYLLYGQ